MSVLSRRWRLLATLTVLAASAALAQDAKRTQTPRIIGTHQIDRYEAVEQVRRDLGKDPKNLTDWVLLGELAQEVALDAPPDRAPGYYRLAREAFDNAVKLDPKNAALKAAASFAREQEQGAEKFGQTRRQTTASYLATRRRELERAGNAPSLRTYAAPAQPAPGQGAATPRFAYFYPTYQPFVGAGGEPYGYQQHYDSFFGPVEARTPDQGITATERAALVKPGARFAPP